MTHGGRQSHFSVPVIVLLVHLFILGHRQVANFCCPHFFSCGWCYCIFGTFTFHIDHSIMLYCQVTGISSVRNHSFGSLSRFRLSDNLIYPPDIVSVFTLMTIKFTLLLLLFYDTYIINRAIQPPPTLFQYSPMIIVSSCTRVAHSFGDCNTKGVILHGNSPHQALKEKQAQADVLQVFKWTIN